MASERTYTMGQAREIIQYTIDRPLERSNRCLYLEGPPGIGKTAMCHAIYEANRVSDDNRDGFHHFINIVAPERDVMEFGMPFPNKARDAVDMIPLSDLKNGVSGRCFVLIDEIDKANNMMQNVLGRIAHEQGIHNLKLAPGSVVVMAGNRMTDRSGSFTANSHIKGRRTDLPVAPDYMEWIDQVAIPDDYHPAVVSYIRTDPKMLCQFDPAAKACPMPRTWSKVGEQLNNTDMPGHVERALIEGDIGVEAANTFWGHLKIHRNLRSPETIIRDPKGAKIPDGKESTAVMWAEVTALARYCNEHNNESIFTYMNRLPGEFSFCGYRDVLLREPLFVTKSKAGQSWMVKNATLLQSTKG